MKNYLPLTIALVFCAALNAQVKKIIVAADGSGNYTTVQAAFDAIPLHNARPVNIFVKEGVYKEKLHLDATKNLVTLTGENAFNTLLTYDDHTGKITPAGDTINTRTSASCVIKGDGFTATNITFQNDAGFAAGQAVALEVQGDKAAFYHCRITGNQDVLLANNENSRQFYGNCYIEGTTDFIFGPATAWFLECHIHSKKNSYVTAASTPQAHAFGYIFSDCMLTADTGINRVSLGRPWRPYGSVTYLHCYLDRHITPEGWANWNTTDFYKTARYAEYQNYGPGANTSARVAWSRQLQEAEVKKITYKNVFGDWNPGKL